MNSRKAMKMSNKYAKCCAVLPDDVQHEVQNLPRLEQLSLISNNTKLVVNSYHQEVLTILLVLEDGKLVSKLDAPIEEQVSIADMQTQLRFERMKGNISVKDLEIQRKMALMVVKQKVINEGKTPIVINNTVHKLNINYDEFILCLRAINQSIPMIIFMIWEKIGIISFQEPIVKFCVHLMLFNISMTLGKMFIKIWKYVEWWMDNNL